MKILIIQTAFIGDAILATGLAERLHAVFPEARIDFMLRKGNEGLLKGHPFLHTVRVWDKKGGKYRDLFRIWREIRRERYDLVVNLQRFFATGLLAALSGAPHRAGFDKNPFSFAFTHRAAHLLGNAHEIDRNHTLIEPWTGPGASRPRLYPAPVDYEGIPQEPYVCLAPTSVWFTKQWPAENWIGLIDRLPAAWTVVLLGGPGDRDACERIASASRHPHILNQCGKLSFLQSAAWMAGAKMNYVNDSAPMHIASAMNAPVTAVFCSTTPAFGFTPLSDRSRVVETSLDLPCRPCGLHGKMACPEGHFNCSQIEVEKLIAPLNER